METSEQETTATPEVTATESVETSTAVETTPETAAPTTSDDLWNIELKLPEPEAVSEDVAVSETEPLPESPNPSEPAEKSDEEVEQDDEPVEQRLENHDPDKPVKLSRRQAAKMVESIIEPLRDEKTPIEDVFQALTEFHPTRTHQLAEKLVHTSIEAAPDAWLQAIVGKEGITVEQVKALVEGGGTPLNPAPVSEFESQPAIASAISQLNEIYGESWRDAANDDDILASDLPYVQAFRAQIERESAQKQAHDAELTALKNEIQGLKPQIDEIKQAKEAEFAQKEQEILFSTATEYRTQVETAAIPRVLKTTGLEISETDSPEVKAAKEIVLKDFKSPNGYASAFENFMSDDFSQKDAVQKSIVRVDNYLKQAAKLDTDALRNPNQAATLKQQANSLRSQAKAEQDALTVWTQKAASEYIGKTWEPIRAVFEKLAKYERGRGDSARPELTSATSGNAGDAWASRVQNAQSADDLWSLASTQSFGVR